MLTRIRCAKFRSKEIRFRDGLNVVLGDDAASNSIGKSTVLMVIDFAFGGSDLVAKTPDVAEQLGEHLYEMWFAFDGAEHHFSRSVGSPNVVLRHDQAGKPAESLSLDGYTKWLGERYALIGTHITFRGCVSPFFRIWKRETLDVDRPLRSAGHQPDADAVLSMLKTFARYDEVSSIGDQWKAASDQKKSLAAAQRTGVVPNPSRRRYQENEKAIVEAEGELAAIKSNLAGFVVTVDDAATQDAARQKQERDALTSDRARLRARMRRIERNLEGTTRVEPANFSQLREFFGNVNEERLRQIEVFHAGISKILRAELEAAKREIDRDVTALNERISSVDESIRSVLEVVDAPKYIIDRIVRVAGDIRQRRSENDYADALVALRRHVRQLETEFNEKLAHECSVVSSIVNRELGELSARVFPPARRSPKLTLEPKRYQYAVEKDTGTGTTYVALVLLDLAILRTSQLPGLIHDSLLFKNVELELVNHLIAEYVSIKGKQIFIAIDEVSKYGPPTNAALRANAVLQLSHSELLYDVDWRRP